jgi:hypothetical protein
MINLVMQELIHRMQALVVEDSMVSMVHLGASKAGSIREDNKLILRISLRCSKGCLVEKELVGKAEMFNKL